MAHAFHVFLLGYMLANSSRFPHVFLQKNPQKTLQQFSIDLENHHIIMRKSKKKNSSTDGKIYGKIIDDP